MLALPAEKEFTRIFFSGILLFEVELIQKANFGVVLFGGNCPDSTVFRFIIINESE